MAAARSLAARDAAAKRTARAPDGPRRPVRRCIVTGEVRPREEMLRFVRGPDGRLVPDIAGTLPGRGLWLQARRDVVETASAKKLFAKAARAAVTVPGDLADRIAVLLRRRALETLGLARRAGQAVAGFEKVRSWLETGRAGLVLAAVDGAPGGRAKVAALARDVPVVALLTAAELGAATGRPQAVHVAVAAGAFSRRLRRDLARLSGFVAPTE